MFCWMGWIVMSGLGRLANVLDFLLARTLSQLDLHWILDCVSRVKKSAAQGLRELPPAACRCRPPPATHRSAPPAPSPSGFIMNNW